MRLGHSLTPPWRLLLVLSMIGCMPLYGMKLDATGMVMNSNRDNLPAECSAISRDYKFSVTASVDYAQQFPGNVFGLSQHEYQVEPCSRLTVTFINHDQVRHQWMVHGLPNYLYPGGMFLLEAAGGQRQTGTFIVPGSDKTYLVHCDLPQHMEKGMKGQLKVGSGSGNLWAVPGVSADFNKDSYGSSTSFWLQLLCAAAGVLIGAWCLRNGA